MHSDVPFVALSNGCDPEAIARMLTLGADDWISHPFHFCELENRLYAQMRLAGSIVQYENEPTIKVGQWRLNTDDQLVWIDDAQIPLTYRESGLLSCLMQAPEVPISTEQLCLSIWGDQTNRLKAKLPLIVLRLRRKLQSESISSESIVNVRGYGYKLMPNM